MADSNSSDVLNRVLARLNRSLLQYAVDCWPWSSATDTAAVETPEQKSVEQMTLRQQQFVARLVDLIMVRDDTVDLGSFPDNSELHYVSLEYLLGKLIKDEQELVAALQSALSALESDVEARTLVAEILAAEHENIERLRELSNSAPAAIVA
ncbi:MAG TPA: hypothetical protein VGH74_09690 [Planctomycetaceae bacterium]|jgi:hypothetical protein